MPLLALFSTAGTGFVDTATNGVVAEEIVRSLVGSIGLIAAVPITTGLAAAMHPAQATGTAPPATGPSERSGPTRFFDDTAWTARAGREGASDE